MDLSVVSIGETSSVNVPVGLPVLFSSNVIRVSPTGVSTIVCMVETLVMSSSFASVASGSFPVVYAEVVASGAGGDAEAIC